MKTNIISLMGRYKDGTIIKLPPEKIEISYTKIIAQAVVCSCLGVCAAGVLIFLGQVFLLPLWQSVW